MTSILLNHVSVLDLWIVLDLTADLFSEQGTSMFRCSLSANTEHGAAGSAVTVFLLLKIVKKELYKEYRSRIIG